MVLACDLSELFFWWLPILNVDYKSAGIQAFCTWGWQAPVSHTFPFLSLLSLTLAASLGLFPFPRTGPNKKTEEVSVQVQGALLHAADQALSSAWHMVIQGPSMRDPWTHKQEYGLGTPDVAQKNKTHRIRTNEISWTNEISLKWEQVCLSWIFCGPAACWSPGCRRGIECDSSHQPWLLPAF